MGEVQDHLRRPLTLVRNPSRIISMAPNVTEILLALGLGGRLVGVTNFCEIPKSEGSKTRIGDLQNPNLEVILSLKPDLVLATTSGNLRETVEKLAGLGLPVYTLDTRTLEEIIQSVLDVGDITGVASAAKAAVADMRRRLAAVQRQAQTHPPRRVLYLIWHDPIVAPGGDSFINDALRWAGGISITADAAERSPRYSLEQIIAQKPEYIFVPIKENPVTMDYFRQSPGWSSLTAVRSGRVFFITAAIQHPSPRVMEGIEEAAAIFSGPDTPR